MIKELHLGQFGTFDNCDFPFGIVTLFTGPNESGKTTIVDALCDVLCKPKKNRTTGKRLALRYGTKRLVSADFDDEPISISEDAFYDLFAIRSGDLSLNVKPGSSWVESLKADLFTAGLDPKRLHSSMSRRASTDGGSRHNRELRQLREEQHRLDERRAVLGDRAASARNVEADTNERSVERTRVAAELDVLTEQVEERQRQERRRLQQAEQREAERLLQLLEEFAREPMDVPSEDTVSRLQRLSDDRDAAAQEVTQVRAELEQARARLQDRVSPVQMGSGAWSTGVGTPSLGLTIGLSLAAGGIAAGGSFFVGLSIIEYLLTGGAVAIGTLVFASLLRRRATGLAELRNDTDGAAERLRVRREHHNKTEQELRKFLQDNEVNSKEQFFLKLGSARAEDARHRDAAEEVAIAVRAYGLSDAESLRELLQGKLRILADGVSVNDPDEMDAINPDLYQVSEEKNQRARVIELRAQLEKIDEQVARGREKAAELSGGAAEIDEVDSRRSVNERRINSLELDRVAASIAASLFARIAGESTAALDDLSADISDRYATVLGILESAERSMLSRPSETDVTCHADLPSLVPLDALEEAAMITDAMGGSRRPDHLSAGTLDAYSLAARLSLVERAHRGPGLLILDEPFHTMDIMRMKGALNLITRFQEHTGWQLVIMTADERVETAVTNQFTEVRIHRLLVGG